MWSWYGVHTMYHCVHGISCLCTLSTSVFMHWAIPTWARFLFRNLFMETCFCSFFMLVIRGAAHVIAVAASFVHVCWWMASTLCSLSLPGLQESASGKSQLHSKQTSIKSPSPENFVTIDDFWPFQVYHFKNSYYTLLLLLQTGACSIIYFM